MFHLQLHTQLQVKKSSTLMSQQAQELRPSLMLKNKLHQEAGPPTSAPQPLTEELLHTLKLLYLPDLHQEQLLNILPKLIPAVKQLNTLNQQNRFAEKSPTLMRPPFTEELSKSPTQLLSLQQEVSPHMLRLPTVSDWFNHTPLFQHQAHLTSHPQSPTSPHKDQ